MTNKEFCYWLQGFFEISKNPRFSIAKVNIIHDHLKNISQPLGPFTSWLSGLAIFLIENYNHVFADYFQKKVSQELNALFYHVIDNTYDTPFTPERKKIHDGVPADVK